MGNSKLVHFFIILFTFISIYCLSFTWMNFQVNKKANEIATNNGVFNLEKKQKYLDSIWDKEAYKIFGKSFTYEQIKNRSLNFGLDLQGGMSIVIDVDVDNLLIQIANDKYKQLVEGIVRKIDDNIKLNTKKYIDKVEGLVKFEGKTIVECFESKKNDIIVGKTMDEDVKKFLIDKINKSTNKTYEVIKNRLDKYGVIQPSILKLKGGRKMQIEISGAYNQKNVKDLLNGVGELKFYLLYESEHVKKIVENLNKVIEKNGINDKKGDKIVLNNEMRYDKAIIDDILHLLNRPEIKELLPDNLIVCKGAKDFSKKDGKEGEKESIYFLKTDENGDEFLNGDVITDARQTLDERGKHAVLVRMNAIGKKLWGELTGNNVGKIIAITLDNEVIMAANVMYKITDGITQISGGYSNEEARNLAMTLKTGSLPVPIHIVGENVVGANLSSSAKKQGLRSIVYGTVIIFLFMVVFYSRSGLVANIALIFNFLFILGMLAQIGAVLTLPGIAGLILTLGMAIDANVLINERIKEELLYSKGVKEAVKIGYNKASSSIIDSNITTLLTGFALYIFGSGTIRCFAVALIVGIIFSFFTSVFITRYIFYKKAQNKTLKHMKFSWNFSKRLLKGMHINFVKKRRISYILSATVLTAGIIGFVMTKGFKLGIDFTGGNTFVVKFSKEIDPSELGNKLSKELNESVEAKTFGDKSTIKLFVNIKNADSSKLNDIVSMGISSASGFTSVKGGINGENTFEIISNEAVENCMASDMKNNSMKAVMFVFIVIFLYILVRFKKWQYSLAAIIALGHDVLLVFSICGIAGMCGYTIEVNQIFVAAILTIIGYSINGTVIIFDRLREIINNGNVFSISTIDNAINSTLSRTVMTSFSTILVVIVLYIFGGIALSNFSFILLCGFIIGAYSSVFLSAPLLTDMLRLKE